MKTPRTIFPAVLLSAACSLAACAAPQEESSDEGADALGRRAGAEQLPTTEPGISLLDGYSTLLDMQRTQCVVADVIAPNIGQPTSKTSIQQVKDDVELARELGLDATLSVKAPTASGSASASMLRNFKSTSNSVSFLIKVVHQYVATQRGGAALTEQAAHWLREDPNEFLHRCGDRFVGSITYEARVSALVTFEAASEEGALKLQSEITAGGGAGVANLDGSIKGRLTNASKQDNVRTSVEILAQGFDAPEAELPGLGASFEDKLAHVEALARAIGPSVRADQAADRADYASNRGRNAIPSSLTLVRYSAAAGGPKADERAFVTHFETLRKTETYLRAFGQLELSMERAYKNEIEPFLNAGPNSQAGYNLAPPAAPKRYAAELAPIANLWAARFRSERDVEVGTDLQALRDVVATCVNGAKDGNYEGCRLEIADPKTLPEWKRGRAAIDAYKQTGRIVKMTAYVVDPGTSLSYRGALDACNDMNGWVNRLPTIEEAKRLAPLVAGYGGGQKKTIWIADHGECKFDRGMFSGGMSFFQNPLSGQEMKVGCQEWKLHDQGSEATVCVGQRGPIGKLIDL